MLTNGDYDVLCAASVAPGGVTAYGLLVEWYKSSKQPGKKIAGIYRRLRSMQRRGLLSSFSKPTAGQFTSHYFHITAAGRMAGKSEQVRRSSFDAPQFPRLASC